MADPIAVALRQCRATEDQNDLLRAVNRRLARLEKKAGINPDDEVDPSYLEADLAMVPGSTAGAAAEAASAVITSAIAASQAPSAAAVAAADLAKAQTSMPPPLATFGTPSVTNIAKV
jgi:hypothetical protein